MPGGGQTIIPGGGSGGITPDLEGFREAQELLRQELGQDVTFHIPIPKVWPPGTAIDRETGEPFDLTVEPVSGGGDEDVIKRCSVKNQLVGGNLGGEGAGADKPGGVFLNETVGLGLSAGDYGDIETATEVTVGDVRYRITQMVLDPALNLNDRYLIFGEAE